MLRTRKRDSELLLLMVLITLLMLSCSQQNNSKKAAVKSDSLKLTNSSASMWELEGSRQIDGSYNNVSNPTWGAVSSQLRRLSSFAYEDGVSEPRGGLTSSTLPNPRLVSNLLMAQDGDLLNDRELTHFLFQWGQFVDHDISLTEENFPLENFFISITFSESILNPYVPVPLLRARFDSSTGTSTSNPRQHINQITAFIDASNVYGSDEQRAGAIREGYGGLLKTSDGTKNVRNGLYLPFNTRKLYNAAPPPKKQEEYFLAGDIRANEQPGLTSMHTLFVREHNRIASEMAQAYFAGKDLASVPVDSEIYERSKAIVNGIIQVITFYEFLPALLGPRYLKPYSGYKANIDPGIASEFSGALYRFGHSAVPLNLSIRDLNGAPLLGGVMPIADAFFNPETTTSLGVEPFFMGLSRELAQEIDTKIHSSLRNLLFAPPAQFDLGATNLQRARDMGIPGYQQLKAQVGLRSPSSFSEVSSDLSLVQRLSTAYSGSLEKIDPWIGALAEDHIPGGSVGELLHKVVSQQFERLRDGDRFYFENYLPAEVVGEILKTRLSDVIKRNTRISKIQDEVFYSSDSFVYRASSSTKFSNVSLGCEWLNSIYQLVLRDVDSGLLLGSKALASSKKIVIFGNTSDNHIRLASCLMSHGAPRVEVFGMGGRDVLSINSSGVVQKIQVLYSGVRNAHQEVAYGGIETIRLIGSDEVDSFTIHDSVDADLSLESLDIFSGAGHDLITNSASRVAVSLQ